MLPETTGYLWVGSLETPFDRMKVSSLTLVICISFMTSNPQNTRSICWCGYWNNEFCIGNYYQVSFNGFSLFAGNQRHEAVGRKDNRVPLGLQARGWKFMRQRTDKSFPNSFTTAQGESQIFAMYRRVVAITITNRRQSENFSYPEVLIRGSFAQEVIRTWEVL